MDRAYHAMLQEEQLTSHRCVSLDRDNVMALGHDISTCFFKNGFPDWWGDRPRGSWRGAGLKPAGTTSTGGQGTSAGASQGRDTAHAA
ncbi:hypothetical protein LIER_37025 [Lithospermum erythrorhizon]|uniref:Uncharacterized protein n=1 Tax=Lithospermum erythrorhizon TaxID=34254 RepID=A0AAV3PE26_LITER